MNQDYPGTMETVREDRGRGQWTNKATCAGKKEPKQGIITEARNNDREELR